MREHVKRYLSLVLIHSPCDHPTLYTLLVEITAILYLYLHVFLDFFFSFKVEEKSSISPLVAGLRKDVQALITEVSYVKIFGLNMLLYVELVGCNSTFYYCGVD